MTRIEGNSCAGSALSSMGRAFAYSPGPFYRIMHTFSFVQDTDLCQRLCAPFWRDMRVLSIGDTNASGIFFRIVTNRCSLRKNPISWSSFGTSTSIRYGEESYQISQRLAATPGVGIALS